MYGRDPESNEKTEFAVDEEPEEYGEEEGEERRDQEHQLRPVKLGESSDPALVGLLDCLVQSVISLCREYSDRRKRLDVAGFRSGAITVPALR